MKKIYVIYLKIKIIKNQMEYYMKYNKIFYNIKNKKQKKFFNKKLKNKKKIKKKIKKKF